jgi:hypothetical protein
MKRRYQNDIEDLVAFNRHFYANTPLLRKQVRFLALFLFLIFIPLPLLSALSQRDTSMLIAALVVAGTLTAVAYPCIRPYLLWICDRNARRLFRQQPDKAGLVSRELEIVGDELVDSNELCLSRWKLSAIEDIVETRDHVFLRISPMRAYILPRDQLDPAELEAFLDDLEHSYYSPDESPPVPSEAIQADRRRPWLKDIL